MLHVGTSGFSYKEWKGSFYPEDMPAKDFLRFYAEHFSTVEINNSFYRMPKEDLLAGWAAQVSDSFRFILKAPQRITHFQRLKGAEDTTAHFLKVAATLGDKLGPLLFQLPPNMKKDATRLADFLPLLGSARAAFEFRNQSWFDDEIFDLLRSRNIALCLAEAEDELDVPFTSTADWGYIRLRLPEYTDKDLKAWHTRIKKANWADAYVFFKHEDEGKGPAFGARFLKLAK